MAIFGEINALFELLGKVRRWFQDHWDPAHAQARRLIETFEAFGIARQQLCETRLERHRFT